MENEQGVKKKSWLKVPHTYTIIFAIIFSRYCKLYYTAGEFERVEDEEGRMLVVDGSYHHIESEPVSFLKCLQRFQWVSKKGLKLFSTFFSQWCIWYYSFYRCY